MSTEHRDYGIVAERKSLPSIGHLVSVRILSNQPDTSSFHVRLGLSAKDCCDQLIDRGHVIINSRIHAVAMADPLQEIRHCLRFQNYGHLLRFFKSAAETCGMCSGPHANSCCTATPIDFKFAKCSKNHCAGSRVCPVNTKPLLNTSTTSHHDIQQQEPVDHN